MGGRRTPPINYHHTPHAPQEELGILREALDTIAESSIAKTQIGVCLAMEAREQGSDEKAKILQKVGIDRLQPHCFTSPPLSSPLSPLPSLR